MFWGGVGFWALNVPLFRGGGDVSWGSGLGFSLSYRLLSRVFVLNLEGFSLFFPSFPLRGGGVFRGCMVHRVLSVATHPCPRRSVGKPSPHGGYGSRPPG